MVHVEVGITWHIVGRGPSKDHSTKVWLQLAQRLPKRRFLCGFPIGLYVKLSSTVGAILVEGLHGRTYFWKRTTQWLLHQNLVIIEQIVSDTPLDHVSYCHHFSSVVHPSTFHMLIFSSETTGPIATKLWWNGLWVTPFQICVRWSRLPTKLAVKLKIGKGGMKLKRFLVEGLHGRTYFWKRTTQWLFHQNLLIIEQIVSDTLLEGNHPRIISAKFGWDWLSSFRGEDIFLISSPLFLF
jgi:hypothetical protein